jgi:hypothetical protein
LQRKYCAKMIPVATREVLRPPSLSNSKVTQMQTPSVGSMRSGNSYRTECIEYVFKPVIKNHSCNVGEHDSSSECSEAPEVASSSVGCQTDLLGSGIYTKDTFTETDSMLCTTCGASMIAMDLAKDIPLFEKAKRLKEQQNTIEEFISDSKSQLERLKSSIASCKENSKLKRDIGYGSTARTPLPQATPVDCFVSVQALRSSGETGCRLSEAGKAFTDNMTRSPCMSPSPIRRRNINHWAQSPAEPTNRSHFPVVRPVTIEELGEIERKK